MKSAVLLICILAVIVTGCMKSESAMNPSQSAPGASIERTSIPSDVEKNGVPIALKMLEIHVGLVNFLSEGEKSGASLTKQQLADAISWLNKLKFSQFPGEIRQDFEAYRSELLKTCKNPPKAGDGYGEGHAYAQLGFRFLTLMVDFDLDDVKANKYGFKKLARHVDSIALILAHTTLITEADLDMDKINKMKPATRIFIELYTICNFLAGSEGKNEMLQGSVYCVHPESLPDQNQRKTLTLAKENIIGLSHCRSEKDEKRLFFTLMSISYLCDSYKVCRISDADLKNAGGDALVKEVHTMLKLREGKVK